MNAIRFHTEMGKAVSSRDDRKVLEVVLNFVNDFHSAITPILDQVSSDETGLLVACMLEECAKITRGQEFLPSAALLEKLYKTSFSTEAVIMKVPRKIDKE